MMAVHSGAARLHAADPSERASVLRGPSRPDFLRDEVLAEIFAASVEARRSHPALVFGERRLSYGEVDEASDAVARGLVRLGIGPGDTVGLWMDRGADLLLAQIAITKTGAAWLPFDADAPAERIAVCLEDCEARGLLTSEAFSARAPTGRPILTASQLVDPSDRQPLRPREKGLSPDHPAYMIYTSGSTGTPKGIVVTQRNICHFLRAANDLYGFRADDVVFQGASVAFDLSMEEVWIPLMVGATLFVASPAVIGDVERLPDLLAGAGVTVIDTVPTLLSLLTRDVPGLRLILLGGEALPPPLVSRWAKGERRLFNTYGPTEATVVATACEVRPGEPVTIGGPIANYSAYVVAKDGGLCRPGQQGELWIGGPGVAHGYLKRPELTGEKFVANPFDAGGGDPILYRSGDAVSLTEGGELAFHGRIDDQVKIRGFRVELGEIETRVAHLPGIAQAAVVLRQDDGLDRLVAFLVAERGASPDPVALRAALRRDLPAYMLPDHFETVSALPRLSSGKVDRKVLRTLPVVWSNEAGEQEEPRNETEAALLAAAHRALGQRALGLEADFFTDLGGHSLLAARFVSAVRETPALAGITLQDVYRLRTLRAMAGDLIARTGGAGSGSPTRDLSFEPPPLLRRFLCGLAQAVTLPFLIALSTLQWLGLLLAYLTMSGEGLDWWSLALLIVGLYILVNVASFWFAIAAKWILIGRAKPGRYPLWGTYYFRFWLVGHLLTLAHSSWLQGTPLMATYLRLLGARVGRDAVIADLFFGAPDLIRIGSGTTISNKVAFSNTEVVGNAFVIGEIEVGDDVTIGSSCAVQSGARIGDGAELADLTVIGTGVVVGAREQWDGSPGRKVGTVDVARLPAKADAGPGRRALLYVTYLAAVLLLPSLSLIPIFPSFYLFDRIDDILALFLQVPYYWYLPVLATPSAAVMIAFNVLLIALMRWAILPKVRSGTHSVFSGFYLRKWIVALSTEITLETLSALYATLFMRAWYRLMGAEIGRGAEISTNLSGRYDIVGIGANNFIADEVIFGDEDMRRGWMTLAPVSTGNRVFVGNDAVVAPGARIPDGTLIGIKSKPPANEEMGEGETWFGSPPIKLPTRQRVDGGELGTFEPTLRIKLGRLAFEALRISFPTMLVISLGMTAVDLFLYPAVIVRNWSLLAFNFVAASVVLAIVQVAVVVAIKWLMMGRYVPTMRPMWSWWALRTEAVGVLYNGLACRVLLDHLTGTPFLPWALRPFGVKIGRGVCLMTTDMTEFDCVRIGDFCTINWLSALQTHLFEDRVMKVGEVEIGRGVSIGAKATVLYETRVGDHAQLAPLTIIMKGESIPANSRWEGAPAAPVVEMPEAARIAA